MANIITVIGTSSYIVWGISTWNFDFKIAYYNFFFCKATGKHQCHSKCANICKHLNLSKSPFEGKLGFLCLFWIWLHKIYFNRCNNKLTRNYIIHVTINSNSDTNGILMSDLMIFLSNYFIIHKIFFTLCICMFPIKCDWTIF